MIQATYIGLIHYKIFNMSGNCELCKERIEKATKSVKLC